MTADFVNRRRRGIWLYSYNNRSKLWDIWTVLYYWQ